MDSKRRPITDRAPARVAEARALAESVKPEASSRTARPAGPAKPSKRAARRAELRQRIYDAALALFRREGVAGATIRQIARDAGVGVGTFFNYFTSKEDVLAELGRQRQARIDALLASPALAEAPARVRVEAILRELAAALEEEPVLARGAIRAALNSPGLFSGERGRFIALAGTLAGALRQGQERGEVAAEADVEAASHLIISAYVALALDWTAGTGDYALVPALLTHVEALWRGLAP